MEDFDISQMFDKAFEDAAPKKAWTKPEGCYEWKELMFTWNRGSVLGLLIPDKNGLPFKTLSRCLYGKIVYDNEGEEATRTVRWCDSKNYKNLTDEQRELNNKLGDEINKYMELFPDVRPRMKFGSKVSYFYFMIKKIIPEDGEPVKYDNPCITLSIHAAAGFPEAFKNKIKSTTETFESPNWMKKFFNRNKGTHEDIININTTQPGGRGAYQINFSFDNLPSLAVEVDDSHLESAKDLNTEFINVNEYDMNYNQESYDIIKKVNDEAESVESLPEVKEPEVGGASEDQSVEVDLPKPVEG